MSKSKLPNLKSLGYPAWAFGQFYDAIGTLEAFQIAARSPWTIDFAVMKAETQLRVLKELFETYPLLRDLAIEKGYDLDRLMDVQRRKEVLNAAYEGLLGKTSARLVR